MFVLLQAGLAVSLDGWLASWRDPNYVAHHQRLKRLMERHPRRPVVLVAGSSRVMNGLCPEALASADGPLLVNWGMPGHSPFDVALRVDRLLREGPRPAALVLEVFPAMLTTKVTDSPPVPVHFHAWNDLQTATTLSPQDNVAGAWRDARLLPWFNYRHNILDRYLPSWQPPGQRNDMWWRKIDQWGWMPPRTTRTQPDLRCKMIASFRQELLRPEVHPDQARALEHVLSLCRRERVPVTLLLMPESPAFRECYGPGTRRALDAFMDSQCRGFGARLVDGRDWFDAEEDFCDAVHLLPDAAQRFTVRLAGEVVPPLLALRAAND